MTHSIDPYFVEPIGYIDSCFSQKFGIPRQPLLCPSATGKLSLLSPFNQRDCVEGLDQVSHIWLTFVFHEHVDKQWRPKVRPPRLGGNKKLGVFATRSSFRPNNIGLSVVKLERIECRDQEVILYLSGIDLLDKTPVIDIKPYVPYADSIGNACNTIAPASPSVTSVSFSSTVEAILENTVSEKLDSSLLKQLIVDVLQQDPRPAYHAKKLDEGREYNMYLHDVNIAWVYKREAGDSVSIYVKSVVKI